MSVSDLNASVIAAEELFARGRYRDALKAFRDALATRTRVRNTDNEDPIGADLMVIERLAELSNLHGEVTAAERLFEAYVGFAAAHDNQYAVALARLTLAQLKLNSAELRAADEQLYLLGPFAEQLECSEFSPQGLDEWEEGSAWSMFPRTALPTLLTRFYLVRGKLLMANGQYAAACMLLNRGLQHATDKSPLSARRARSALQFALVQARAESGDLAEADRVLASGDAELNATANPGLYVERWELATRIALLRGELGQGLRHLKLTLQFCSDNGFERAALIASLNVAELDILLNRTDEAAENLRQVQESAIRGGHTEITQRSSLLLTIAKARMASLADSAPPESVSELWGQSARSKRDDDDAEAPPPNLPARSSFLGWLDDRILAVRWYLSRLEPITAARMQAQLSEVFGDTDSLLVHARLRFTFGMVAYYRAQYVDSLTALEEASRQFEQMGLRPERWQALRFLAWTKRKLGHSPEVCAALVRDADRLLEELTASLPDEDRAVFLLNKWTADEEVLARLSAELIELRRRAADSSTLSRVRLREAILRGTAALANRMQIHKIRIAEATLERSQRSTEEHKPDSWIAMVLRHSPRDLSLSFVVLPDRILILRRGFLALDLAVVPMSRVRLRHVVRAWHESVRSKKDAQAHRRLSLRLLGEALGIRALLARRSRFVRRLTLDLDDILHGFPFGALECDGRYLVERFACSSRVYSAAPEKRANVEGPALIVGISAAVAGAARLLGVKHEAHRVQSELQRAGFEVRALRDSQASMKAVCTLLPRAPLVHWSGHGIFRIDRPDQSGLILVTEDGRPEVLSLRELSRLDFGAVKQITLSSCWSADNYVTPSRWVISLPQTLCQAGAQTVLSCLWRVSDARSVVFMTMFYRNLRRMPADRALQSAQIQWIRRARRRAIDADLPDVHDWAGFVLHTKTQVPGL